MDLARDQREPLVVVLRSQTVTLRICVQHFIAEHSTDACAILLFASIGCERPCVSRSRKGQHMWLLLPAAGSLAVVCCLNGYLVYRKLCDKEATADNEQFRNLKRQSSDLVLTVKQWTESSAGQVIVAATVVAVCIYICLDVRMRTHPEVLFPFLVISVCSIGGFVTYRCLAYAKLTQTPENVQPQPQISAQGDSKADVSSNIDGSSSARWYDDWHKQSSRITMILVVSVGLASFQQAIKTFDAGTQLMITSCLAIPLCSLAGFIMYLSNRPHARTSSAEELQQNKQKLAAGLGMLLAFTAGFLGIRSSIGMPVMVACFALPLCCLAGFWMYQYQLYLHPTQSNPAPPAHFQQPTSMPDAVTEQPGGGVTGSPDCSNDRGRLRQNSDIFMNGSDDSGGRSQYATRHSQVSHQPLVFFNHTHPANRHIHAVICPGSNHTPRHYVSASTPGLIGTFDQQQCYAACLQHKVCLNGCVPFEVCGTCLRSCCPTACCPSPPQ